MNYRLLYSGPTECCLQNYTISLPKVRSSYLTYTWPNECNSTGRLFTAPFSKLVVVFRLLLFSIMSAEPLPKKARMDVEGPLLSMAEKFRDNQPYNIFFSIIPKIPSTLLEKNAITFKDLVCHSLGSLLASLQINFLVDIHWVMHQYKEMAVEQKPLTVLYGSNDGVTEEDFKHYPNITYKFVNMRDNYGVHHTKMGIYAYKDNSIRIAVMTANLYFEDWDHHQQGIWLSPVLPQLPEGSSHKIGESPTGFKNDLIVYLTSYNFPCLQEWIARVKRTDFTAVKVFLITSMQGKQYGPVGSHTRRVRELLKKYCELPQKTSAEPEGPDCWSIMVQCSSIGSMGATPETWLRGDLLKSLDRHKNCTDSISRAPINIIYPSHNNVMNSLWGPVGGGCLPYRQFIHDKQRWLTKYFHQWKADRLSRSGAMPHTKTYCRVSPCLTKVAWFLLTSANVSKAAWGTINKDMSVFVRSNEVGVLFLPKFFDQTYFKFDGAGDEATFPFMYDLPIIEYDKNDKPWYT